MSTYQRCKEISATHETSQAMFFVQTLCAWNTITVTLIQITPMLISTTSTHYPSNNSKAWPRPQVSKPRHCIWRPRPGAKTKSASIL